MQSVQQFTTAELNVIDIAVRFLFACLDRESGGLAKDCSILLLKVEKMIRECEKNE